MMGAEPLEGPKRTRSVTEWMQVAFVRLGVLPFLLVIAIVIFALMSGKFLSGQNLINVARQSTYLTMVAMGQMLALLTGGFDLANPAGIERGGARIEQQTGAGDLGHDLPEQPDPFSDQGGVRPKSALPGLIAENSNRARACLNVIFRKQCTAENRFASQHGEVITCDCRSPDTLRLIAGVENQAVLPVGRETFEHLIAIPIIDVVRIRRSAIRSATVVAGKNRKEPLRLFNAWQRAQ